MSNTPKAPNFAYLAEKEPSSLHLRLKEFIEDHGGPEVDLKTIQAVLAAHGKFQKSDYNKSRDEYKARTAQSIYKGGVTTTERFHFVVDEEGNEVRVEGPAPEPKPVPKKAPTRKTTTAKAPAKATTAKAPAKAAPARRTRKPAAAAASK